VDGEVAKVAADVMPWVAAAAGVYGDKVLEKVEESAAGATVSAVARWGKQVLRKVFGDKQQGEPLPEALADVIENPDEKVFVSALESAIAVRLTKDAQVLAEVREIIKESKATVTATQSSQAGDGSVAANINASGNVYAPIVNAGRNAIVAKGDITGIRIGGD
jgi:2',3'-cyclic-nucleotide 2'-phosphodiesterase (5'-nucleotidase family)